MVRSQITTMKIRNRNGRTHVAFSAFDMTFGAFNSATLLSRLAGSSFGGKLTCWINTVQRVSDGKLPHGASSLRKQGPITTGRICYGWYSRCPKSRGRSVWVPAPVRNCALGRDDGLNGMMCRSAHPWRLDLAETGGRFPRQCREHQRDHMREALIPRLLLEEVAAENHAQRRAVREIEKAQRG